MDGERYEHYLDDATLLDSATPLAETVETFLARGPVSGRLMVPLARLDELATFTPPQTEEPLPVAVVCPRTLIPEDWADMLEDAAVRLNRFVGKACDVYEIESFEARVPDLKDLEGYLEDLEGFADAELIVELPDHDGLAEAVAFFADAEGAVGAAFPETGDRTGEFIAACLQLDVPFKLLNVADPKRTLSAIAVAIADDLTGPEIVEALQNGAPRPVTTDEEEAARDVLISVA